MNKCEGYNSTRIQRLDRDLFIKVLINAIKQHINQFEQV